MELVCVGDNVADYYPQKNMFYPGGSAYNVSVIAARYGLTAAYIGTFGTDIAGSHQLRVLKEEGVDISHSKVRSGRNAKSRVINRKGKTRVEEVDKGVYRHFSLTIKDLKFIKKFNYFHSTIYSYTESYLPELKKAGMTISFDYSFKSTAKYLESTAPWVDIAFFSGESFNDDPREFMTKVSSLGPNYVIITMGEKGVLAFLKNKFYFYPSRKTKVVDTLGAGDAFIARFLSCFSRNFTLPRFILKESTESAAEYCGKFGAVGWGKEV